MKIPKDATTATVLDVPMQIIDLDTGVQMLQADSLHIRYSTCILSNGLFLFSIKNKRLNALYKIQGSPTAEMLRIFPCI